MEFLPMSALDADASVVESSETYPYGEVHKGYTCFVDGDILLAKITPCFENGKIAQAKVKTRFGFGSTEFHVLRPDRDRLDARYLVHFLRRDEVRIDGERKMTGSGGQRRVPRHFLESLAIPLPSISEQRRIAAILDQADTLRVKRRQALAHLDNLAQSIFMEMFGDPTANPKRWDTCVLSELVMGKDTINYGVVQPGDDVHGGVPLVRVGDLVDGKVCHDFLKRIAPSIESGYTRSRLRGDEILISCVGSIGIVALTSENEAGFNIARAVARIRLSNAVDRLFMAVQLKMPSIQRYFTQELRTVSQPTLNIKQIGETKVICPPIARQTEFAHKYTAVERLRSSLSSAVDESDSLFASIQNHAFRGEL